MTSDAFSRLESYTETELLYNRMETYWKVGRILQRVLDGGNLELRHSSES